MDLTGIADTAPSWGIPDSLLGALRGMFSSGAFNPTPRSQQAPPNTFRKAEDYGLQASQFGPWGGWWVPTNAANPAEELGNVARWMSDTSGDIPKERALPVEPWMTFNSNPAFQQAVASGKALRWDPAHMKPDQGLDISYGLQHRGRDSSGYVTGGLRPENGWNFGNRERFGLDSDGGGGDLGTTSAPAISGFSPQAAKMFASYLGSVPGMGLPGMGAGLVSAGLEPAAAAGVSTLMGLGGVPTSIPGAIGNTLGGPIGRWSGLSGAMSNTFPMTAQLPGQSNRMSAQDFNTPTSVIGLFSALVNSLFGGKHQPFTLGGDELGNTMNLNNIARLLGISLSPHAGWTDTFNLTSHPGDVSAPGPNLGPSIGSPDLGGDTTGGM